jgi:hypothetical protein
VITANIHSAVAVEVQRTTFSDFHSLRFVVTTADGNQIEISAFSAMPLTLTDTTAQPAQVAAQEVAA